MVRIVAFTRGGAGRMIRAMLERTWLALAVLLVSSSPAWAQASRAPEGNKLVPMMIAFAMIVAVAVASFMSSRRGHQD